MQVPARVPAVIVEAGAVADVEAALDLEDDPLTSTGP